MGDGSHQVVASIPGNIQHRIWPDYRFTNGRIGHIMGGGHGR